MWGIGRKAQWQIEELSVEHLLAVSANRVKSYLY